MQSIVYVSEQSIPFDLELLAELCASAAQRNRTLGLTGYLNWKNGRFLQYLEGPNNALSEVMDAITSDTRHVVSRTLHLDNLDRRLFGGWDMLNLRASGHANIRMQDLIENVVLSMHDQVFDESNSRDLILDMLQELGRLHDTAGLQPVTAGSEIIGGKKTPYVVALGASAGGLQPLQSIIKSVTSQANAAYIVIQHFSPETETMMDSILQRDTRMPVCAAADGMRVEEGRVYVIPPGENLEVANRCFHLSRQQRLVRGPQYPIDICFRSLAREYADKAIAIILSGTGTDGSRGAKVLQEAGGVVLAQTPETAEFDGMPNASIEAGVVHQILTPPEIANFINCLGQDSVSDALAVRPEKRAHYVEAVVEVLAEHDIDFSQYKNETLFRRIERRRLLASIPTVNGYIDFLRGSVREQQALRDDILITVTSFFRDPEAWEYLKTGALPALLDDLQPGETLRAWVTACSTGEEAYTVAMILRELIDTSGKDFSFKVYATDVERKSLDLASTGIYSEHAVAHLNPERRERFFAHTHDGFMVKRDLREHVIFAPHNFVKDAPFTRMHLVTCRNVLIYMQPELQQKAIRMLHFSLNVNGVLFIGSSETLGPLQSEFTPVNREWNQYRKLRNIHLPLHLSSDRALKPVESSTIFKTDQAVNGRNTVASLSLEVLARYTGNTNVLVDGNRAIISVISDPTGILEVRPGQPTVDITQMVPEGIGPSLTFAIARATKEQVKVLHGNLKCDPIGQVQREVDIEVIPHASADEQPVQYALVVISDSATKISDKEDVDAREQSTLDTLQAELEQARKALQVAMNDLEYSNDGQRSVNEQLTAANEELQSTNEELQSVNEELYTVNFEYQTKIHELSDLNHDLDNLLDSTNLGVIFLDSDLRIRRFTEVATRTVNLLPSDIGRPFEDLSHSLDYSELLDDLRRVLSMGRSIEKETTSSTDAVVRVGIHPYKVGKGTAQGVLITFLEMKKSAVSNADNAADLENWSARLVNNTP